MSHNILLFSLPDIWALYQAMSLLAITAEALTKSYLLLTIITSIILSAKISIVSGNR